MAGKTTSLGKARIAHRVIEVLDYFDENHREASVMEIARRYDRPQSSTSDLLSILAELGLLRRDIHARTYSLTPRAALLGTLGQPDFIRDGRILHLMDRLVAQTGLSVALHAMVGIEAQIASWRHGPRAPATTRKLTGGITEPLSRSAVGLLLLSTVGRPRRGSMLRRLNAEAPSASKFQFSQMMARIEGCSDARYVHGSAGFDTDAQAVSCLLSPQPAHQPLAVSIVHGPHDEVNAENLLRCMEDAMRECLPDTRPTLDLEPVPHAA